MVCSYIIIDYGDGTFGADIFIVFFRDVLLCHSDVNADLTLMMVVNLVVIGDNLTAFLGIAGDVVTATGLRLVVGITSLCLGEMLNLQMKCCRCT
jgi:hypothetical protein